MIRSHLSDLAYTSRVSNGGFDTVLVKENDPEEKIKKAQLARSEFARVIFTSDFTGLMGVGRRKLGEWEVEYSGLAFMIEVAVGINVNEPHTNLSGKNDCTMGELLHSLNYYGYDPLFSIKNKQYHDSKQRELAKFVIDDLKRQRSGEFKSSHHTITERVRRWARSIRDDARDYVRGEAADPKMFLSEKTIANRRYKQKHYRGPYGSLYQEGLNEALWETGQLEMSIEVLSVRILKRFEKLKDYQKERIKKRREKDRGKYNKKDGFGKSEIRRLESEIRKERMKSAKKAAGKIFGSSKLISFKEEIEKEFARQLSKSVLHPFELVQSLSIAALDKGTMERARRLIEKYGYDDESLYNLPLV